MMDETQHAVGVLLSLLGRFSRRTMCDVVFDFIFVMISVILASIVNQGREIKAGKDVETL